MPVSSQPVCVCVVCAVKKLVICNNTLEEKTQSDSVFDLYVFSRSWNKARRSNVSPVRQLLHFLSCISKNLRKTFMCVALLAHAQGYMNVNRKELNQQPPRLYSLAHKRHCTPHTHTTSWSGLKQQWEWKNKELWQLFLSVSFTFTVQLQHWGAISAVSGVERVQAWSFSAVWPDWFMPILPEGLAISSV